MFEKQMMNIITPEIKKQIEAIDEKYQSIIDNQNQQIKGLITIYTLLAEIAKKQKIKIPETLIKMEVEE